VKKLDVGDWVLLKNKVRNMRTIYMDALKWSSETGQGVKTEKGEASFEGEYSLIF